MKVQVRIAPLPQCNLDLRHQSVQPNCCHRKLWGLGIGHFTHQDKSLVNHGLKYVPLLDLGAQRWDTLTRFKRQNVISKFFQRDKVPTWLGLCAIESS